MASRLTRALTDPGRLAAVRQTNLLDTPAEDAFDRVARLAARLLEVPIALVPLVGEDRQFFKACVGLPEPWASARQTPLSHSLCQHVVVVARHPLAIGDTARDALARDNPLVRELGLAAYLGVPLIDTSGYAVGSVCVADRRPRDWTPDQVAVLTDLAGVVMTQIQLRAKLATRDELEQRLIDVEASLQALLERLPGVVYALSPEAPNPVLYVSPQIQALVGVSAADCIGDPELWDRLVHPQDLEWVAAECERTNQTGEPFSGEYRMCTTDGQVRWVRDEAVLVCGGDGRRVGWAQRVDSREEGVVLVIPSAAVDHLARLIERLCEPHHARLSVSWVQRRNRRTTTRLSVILAKPLDWPVTRADAIAAPLAVGGSDSVPEPRHHRPYPSPWLPAPRRARLGRSLQSSWCGDRLVRLDPWLAGPMGTSAPAP
jgi:PAS domain S-box-containing protein